MVVRRNSLKNIRKQKKILESILLHLILIILPIQSFIHSTNIPGAMRLHPSQEGSSLSILPVSDPAQDAGDEDTRKIPFLPSMISKPSRS